MKNATITAQKKYLQGAEFKVAGESLAEHKECLMEGRTWNTFRLQARTVYFASED